MLQVPACSSAPALPCRGPAPYRYSWHSRLLVCFCASGALFTRQPDRKRCPGTNSSGPGTVVFAMVQSLGEIVTWLPISGGLTVYAYRYADPALGFAMGWNYALSAGVVLCAEISAASVSTSARLMNHDCTHDDGHRESRLMACRLL